MDIKTFYETPFGVAHDHVFLGEGHDQNGRKTWAVIVLCTAMMLADSYMRIYLMIYSI